MVDKEVVELCALKRKSNHFSGYYKNEIKKNELISLL